MMVLFLGKLVVTTTDEFSEKFQKGGGLLFLPRVRRKRKEEGSSIALPVSSSS